MIPAALAVVSVAAAIEFFARVAVERARWRR